METREELKKGFAITRHKGVRIKFANGWSISIQWGPGNYTTAERNRSPWSKDDWHGWLAPKRAEFWGSEDAEIAILQPNGNWYRPEGEDWGDDVKGYCTPDDVLKYMNMIAKFPKGANNI